MSLLKKKLVATLALGALVVGAIGYIVTQTVDVDLESAVLKTDLNRRGMVDTDRDKNQPARDKDKVRPGIAPTMTVTKNANLTNLNISPNLANSKIGSFVVQNTSTESVRVTSLKIDLSGTSTLANISNLKTSELSGSGAIGIQTQASNTFTVDFTLSVGGSRIIDIFADTGSTNNTTVITALGLGAVGVNTNITINTPATIGQVMTISPGALTTPLFYSSSTRSQYLAVGNNGLADATKNVFLFLTSNQAAVTLKEVKFKVIGNNTVSSMRIDSPGAVSVPIVGDTVLLTGLNLRVPYSTTVAFFASYKGAGTNGVVPGTTSKIVLTEVKYTEGAGTEIKVWKGDSGANVMTLVGSRPTISISTTPVTGLRVEGENKIADVTITADAKGNIKLNKIYFSSSVTGFGTAPITFGSPRIVIGTTSIAGSNCFALGLTVSCEFGTTTKTDFDGYEIPAGTSKTFTLYGTLVGAALNNTGAANITTTITDSRFSWDDGVTNGQSGTNFDGILVPNFPSNPYTLRQ